MLSQRQADLRAVGHRAGRLSARQSSAGLRRMERPVPRRRAPLLARRSGSARRARRAAVRFGGLFDHRQRRPVGVDQFRRRARRLHARTTWSATTQAQRSERRRQQRRPRRQHSAQLGRRRPDRRCGHHCELRARGEARDAGDAVRSRTARRCCSAGDEIGRTQHGNNNAYCQDNEISWSTGRWPEPKPDAR